MVTEAADKLKDIIADNKAESSDALRNRAPWLATFVVVLVVALAWAAYGRTLTSYFLADDFGEVAYMARIASGHWDLFWSNWTGNFMQIPGMAVYRPFLLCSLLADYLVWKGNATGYYLTNLLYYSGDVALIFFVCRQLTRSWNSVHSIAAAGLAAALFAVNPLHCESVSWVVGRVDTACCFYYLCGLWSYLQYRRTDRKLWMVLSVVGFWSGMLMKEMAIGLPILATTISFLSVDKEEPETNLISRARKALLQSSPFWVSTILYFIVRYAALGTLTGGYTGAIGDGQAGSAIQRWFDPETYKRVLLPFAISLFNPDNPWARLLAGSYTALGTVFAIKLVRREIQWKLLLLCLVWLGTAALPIYKLWGVGMDLEGARFCFFLTVAFSATLSLVTLAPSSRTAQPQPPKNDAEASSATVSDASIAIVASVALLAATFALYKTTIRSNSSWVHAGKEVKAVMQSAVSLATNSGSNDRLIVLGIPKKNAGAHLIYNGATFRTGIQPPFVDADYTTKFLTFDPIFYGPDQYINSERLKSSLRTNHTRGPIVWNSDERAFVDASLPGDWTEGSPLLLSMEGNQPPVQSYADGHATVNFENGVYKFTNMQSGDGLQFNNLKIDPRQYDFVELQYRVPGGIERPLTFHAKWHGTLKAAANPQLATAERVVSSPKQQFETVRIPLSHFWRWYACRTITDIAIILPPVNGIQIRDIKLLPASTLRPTMSVKQLADDGSGVYPIKKDTSFVMDASRIAGAKSLLVECSKADYFFDQIEESKQSEAVATTFTVPSATFDGKLPASFVPDKRYCELRVRALDAAGKPLGEYSEATIIYPN